jgi:hypothetical protein
MHKSVTVNLLTLLIVIILFDATAARAKSDGLQGKKTNINII